MLRYFILLFGLWALACTEQQALDNTTPQAAGSDVTDDNNAAVNEPADEPDVDEGIQISGPEYFDSQILSRVNACRRCHTDSTNGVANPGPLTIFDYAAMKVLLDQNMLIPMVRGRILDRPHPTEDPCLSGLNSSPCQQFARWWDIEFGDDPEKADQRPLPDPGSIVAVSADGIVSGWAVNPKNTDETVTVTLSIGTMVIGSIAADQDVFDNDHSGSHGFSFVLDDSLKDGQRRDLRATISANGSQLQLLNTPYSFASLPKTAAGSAFFQNSLNNLILVNCGCHGSSFNYDFSWQKLAEPLATEGGSRTNNRFYSKGVGQQQHAGGNACQGNQVCQTAADWWDAEFGSVQ